MSVKAEEMVTLQINGREVRAPKGMSLVEAASEAGMEIPIFCYEPRLGAGIGACRMCLVEIEGMPKLQTACTTPAADGMVVNSHSNRAREGQDAVLEFLLVNHPLDCPVCDKGGECPLQDLTLRYGPGVTRMTLPKLTFAKPVPISPLIKLDRDRCILCWRCTRFSEEISGDMQLVAENRGASSFIATFEGRPYANEFSGNVTELCPVGALTSSTYRFRARPWEIQNVPTVCGLCPVGCNTYATIRAGHVARVLSRNHPGIDDGWLCDKGRYGYPALSSPARITTTLIRAGRGLEPVAAADGLNHVADRLRATVERFGPGSVAILASGEQTNEEAYAWSLLAERLGNAPMVLGPEGTSGWSELAPYAAAITDLDDAATIVVVGDVELAHRAPVVELRIRRAVRDGARVVTLGAGATRLDTLAGAVHVSASPGTGHAALVAAARGQGELGRLLSERAEVGGTVLIWNGRMSSPIAAVLAHACERLGASLLRTPASANEIGCSAAGLGGAGAEEVLQGADEGRIRSLVLLGADPVSDWPGGARWRAVLERSFFALQATSFQNGSSGWATTIVPATAALESEGTLTNLEGRVQRLRAAARPPAGCVDGLLLASELAARFGLELPDTAALAFARMAAERPAFAGLSWAEIDERAPLPPHPEPSVRPPEPRIAAADGGEAQAGMLVVGYRQLMSGPAVEHTPELHFQRRSAVELAFEDAERLGVRSGDRVSVRCEGREIHGPAVVLRRLRAGVARVPSTAPFLAEGEVAAEEAAGA